MAGHTPGPWHVAGRSIDTDAGITIASIEPQYQYPTPEIHQVTTANARLIAKAPELAELLGRTLVWLNQDEEDENAPMALVRRIKALLAEIDGARGEGVRG